ncbi:MAG: hypothetical protein HZB16_05520 [Armatimonadetes bacterium]|nr:hypothetical protein [Armatimonadota bacterium]
MMAVRQGSLLLLLWVSALSAQAPSATAAANGDAMVVCGQQVLTVGHADAGLELRRGDRVARLRLSILQGKGWATPQPCAEPPALTNGPERASAALSFAVAGDRRLELEATVQRDVPAVFVVSRLRRLGEPGDDYYYWSCDWATDRFASPEAAETPFDRAHWETLPARDWLWLPHGGAGLALLPTNTWGHGATQAAEVGCFIQALPRSVQVGRGDSHDASFGLAIVDEADGARACAAAAEAHGLPVVPTGPPVDYGQPAPDWLRSVEQYQLYYRPAAQWTDTVVMSTLARYPLILGSTPDKAALDRCHRAGIKVLHYVTYTCLLDTARQVAGGGQVYSEWTESIDHETRDLRDHPDWICLDADGQPQRDAWGKEHGHPGLLNTCLHQPGLREAALRQVKMLLELGFDGVFIDLAGPTPECHGKHHHPVPALTNTAAWEQLQADIYRLVKAYDPQRIVVQNTVTGIMGDHWRYCDAQMLEGRPFGYDSAEATATWAELNWLRLRQADAVRAGKVPIVLTALGKQPLDRVADAALYAYASARLAGCAWADNLSLDERAETRPLSIELAAVRLGAPHGPAERVGGVTVRRFERGLVVVNPGASPAEATVATDLAGALNDVGHGTVAAADGRVTLEMAPQSGRVVSAR